MIEDPISGGGAEAPRPTPRLTATRWATPNGHSNLMSRTGCRAVPFSMALASAAHNVDGDCDRLTISRGGVARSPSQTCTSTARSAIGSSLIPADDSTPEATGGVPFAIWANNEGGPAGRRGHGARILSSRRGWPRQSCAFL